MTGASFCSRVVIKSLITCQANACELAASRTVPWTLLAGAICVILCQKLSRATATGLALI